jgi:AraC family transcriptional regulator
MDPRILEAIRIFEQRMDDADVSAECVAAEVGLSVFHFQRLFLHETGDTPVVFQRRIRLEGAAMRLIWTRETIGQIAQGFGYDSQSSFNKAFVGRFGVTPGRFRREPHRWPAKPIDAVAGSSITLHQHDSFYCLARRYLGPYRAVPEHWADFLSRLPAEHLRGNESVFLGLTYDDPRFTPEHQIRYDCCLVLGQSNTPGNIVGLEGIDKSFSTVATRPGLYAGLVHRGSYDIIGASYSLLLNHWVTKSRYTVCEDPAIERYTIPQGFMASEKLELEVFIPLQ